jgi:RHH-type proline utilization regulon transcriptional repressor/proline dehydrogenase/delta 1-pyrroline-5-carboxylate dehydrogenase
VSGFVNEPLLELRRAPVRDALREALVRADERLPLHAPVWIGADRLPGETAFDSTDPGAPGRVVARAGSAGATEIDAAVATAQDGAADWAARDAAERADILRRAATLLRERRLELAALELRECAKPWREADADVCEAIDYLEFYAREAIALDRGRPLEQVPGERNSMRYRARGVVAVIAPWNFPIAIPAGMTAAALATGNVALLKPAEQSPGCAFELVRALRDAGVPAAALAFLPGNGETGRRLVRHADINTIAFTGSAVVGQEIIQAAAVPGRRHVKHVIAEMGGKNCVIVDADADLDEAVPGIVAAAFGYAGQKCSAAARVLAHASIADRLAERLAGAVATLVVGQAEDFATDVPPLIERAARDRVRRYAALAAEQGRIVAGEDGVRLPDAGWFCAPLLVGELPPDSALLHEEIFGPLLTIERVADIDEACARVEALPFALTGGLYSRDPAVVARVVARSPVGNLYVNRAITGAMVGRQPFGGNRLSGTGAKAGGADYLLQYVEPIVVSENTTRHGLAME